MFEAFLYVCLSTAQCFIAENTLGAYPTHEKCIERTQEIAFAVQDILVPEGIYIVSATPHCNEAFIKT